MVQLIDTNHREGGNLVRLPSQEISVVPSSHVVEPIGDSSRSPRMGGIFGQFSMSGLEVPFSMCYGPKVTVLFEGPRFEQLRRYSAVLIEKRRQMLEGWCNLLALDTDEYTGDKSSLSERLRNLIEDRPDSLISGLMLLSKTHGAGQTRSTFRSSRIAVPKFLWIRPSARR